MNSSGTIVAVELGEAVTAALRELILSGEYPPGARLVETSLAERFGTSRGPVRDALAELERSGLVQSVNRRGAFVATFTVADVEELYSLRLAMEVLAVERAVARIGPEGLGTLRTLLKKLAAAIKAGDRRAIAAADMRFHRTIVTAADHSRLLAAWDQIADQTQLLMYLLSEVAPGTQSAVGPHGDLADALEAGNVQIAIAATTAHLTEARDRLMEHLRPAD